MEIVIIIPWIPLVRDPASENKLNIILIIRVSITIIVSCWTITTANIDEDALNAKECGILEIICLILIIFLYSYNIISLYP